MKQDNDKKQLCCRVHTRITQQKFDELTAILNDARGIHSLSHLLRVMLDNKPIIIQRYDATQDKIIAVLSGIRTELRAIGVNINQVTREFHITDYPEGRLARAQDIAKLFQQADGKISQVLTVISNLAMQWSPK